MGGCAGFELPDHLTIFRVVLKRAKSLLCVPIDVEARIAHQGLAGRLRTLNSLRQVVAQRARILWLADEARLERMVRRLHIEQMPDIWGDEDSAQKFEDSFFEDLALRFDTPGKSRIVSVLQEELELTDAPGPEGLKAALVERLKQGFADSIWWGEESDDEHEE
jgi:hypothetical protein